MSSLIALLQHIFVLGRGRPLAIVILLWMTALCTISELPSREALGEVSGNFTRPFVSARQFLFDSYQKYYPREPLSQPVTIVSIDESSLAQIGQWPWPRNKLAELIDAIATYQPAAIGLDMYMPEADQTSPQVVADNLPPGTAPELIAALKQLPSHETRLAQSLRNSPSVLGAAGFDFATYTSSHGMRSAPVMVSGGDPMAYVRKFEAVLVSLPELQAAAQGQAVLSVDLDFGVVRRIPLVVSINEILVSGLAMEMLRIASGAPATRVSVGDHGIDTVSIADLSVPTQAGGDIWLHFARSQSTAFRYLSAMDVLTGKADSEQLTGKLVLLGLTGSGLQDMRTTALGELVPGIEIQAQVLESMFDGRFVIRPWWMKWLEVSSILLIGGLLIWSIPRTDSPLAKFLKAVPRASMWLTLTLNLLLISMGYALFIYLGLLFDASSFFLILSGVVASLISSALIEMSRQEKLQADEEQQIRNSVTEIASRLATSLNLPSHQAVVQQTQKTHRLTILLATEVAKNPNFTGQLDLQTIHWIADASPYRDIGMANVPEHILNQDTQLSEMDRKIMQKHTELSSVAVTTIEESIDISTLSDPDSTQRFLQVLRDVTEGHHERWDGKGYPNGLAEEAIPLAARIVAVIDTYESLISDRPYRSAMTLEQAAITINESSATQFDARIVASFMIVATEFSLEKSTEGPS